MATSSETDKKADGHTLCGACGCLLFPTDNGCPSCRVSLLGTLSDNPWDSVGGFISKKKRYTVFAIWVNPKDSEQVYSACQIDNEELEAFPWMYNRALNSLTIEIQRALRKKNTA